MVMSIHETKEPKRLQWARYLIGTVCASVVFACLWGLTTHDFIHALIGAAIPWALVATCLLVSLSWTIIMIPLLSLIGKVFGGNENRKKK